MHSVTGEKFMSETHEPLIRRWYNEIWNERKPDTIYELFAADAIGHLEGELEIVGPDLFHEFYLELTAAFPNLRITIDEIVSRGESAAVRWTVEATHSGEGYGLPPTQSNVRFRGMSWMHIREGKIIEGWDSWNLGALLQGLKTAADNAK
jgi:steroid delta-isomerase-like uncharacterized protein